MKTSESLFELLAIWVNYGWIRELDLALTRFLILESKKGYNPALILAITLTSHQLGRGHVCLDLKAVLNDSNRILGIPMEQDSGKDTPLPHTPEKLLDGWTLESWCSQIQKYSNLVANENSTVNTPLVLFGHRLYLRRYWRYERQIEKAIFHRIQASTKLDVQTSDLKKNLDLLFPPKNNNKEKIDWQKIACAIAARNIFSIITGGPGTGKTTTVVRLLALLQKMAITDKNTHHLQIHLAAPTGKAAARLKESISGAIKNLPTDFPITQIPTDVTTLHQLLGSHLDSRSFRHNSANRLPLDVLVIDECSMVDIEIMATILDALPDHARLILLGDKDQLASVEAGSVLGALCRHAEQGHYHKSTIDWIRFVTGQAIHNRYLNDHGRTLDQHIVMLRESHRFKENSGIGQLAIAVNTGNIDAIKLIRANPVADLTFLHLNNPEDINGHLNYAGYLHVINQTQPDLNANTIQFDAWAADVLIAHTQFQVLCTLRKGPFGVEYLNQQIESQLKHQKLLRTPSWLTESEVWYIGRPIMVTCNDYNLKLMNGDIGIALPYPIKENIKGSPQWALRVAFLKGDGSNGVRWVLPSRLQTVETVFAMTVHKSQGSEFTHCVLLLPPELNPVLTRELIYTGITRAKAKFTVISFGNEHILEQSSQRQVVRSNGLFIDN